MKRVAKRAGLILAWVIGITMMLGYALTTPQGFDWAGIRESFAYYLAWLDAGGTRATNLGWQHAVAGWSAKKAAA